MPTTIEDGFKKLRDNLRITELQEETVSKRQQNVRAAVEKEMRVLDSFLMGSYRRGTMISPLIEADVDIFVVLEQSYYQSNGQASLLDKVKRIIQKTYPNTSDISRNGQAVSIYFNEFKVDVVPGFLRAGGGYIIADSILARWIETDPKQHIQLWQTANRDHNHNLSPLSKMMKGWNKVHSQLLRSFHLEALVLQIVNDIDISVFPLALGYVFDHARTQVRNPVLDPAGYGGNIGAYLNTQTKVDEVVSRLQSAHTRAVEAISYQEANKIQQAYERWRLIFGDYFPAYG